MIDSNREIEMGMRYISLTSPDINNGLGCRVTLWVAGCRRACHGCHNKETWLYGQGEPLSKVYTRLNEVLSKDYIRGLTVSGGDPLDQCNTALNDLYALLKWVKTEYPTKDIWIYTGDVFENLIDENDPCYNLYMDILKLCDILVDGRFKLEERDITLPFRGSKNQRIIDVKKSLKNKRVVIKEME